MDILKRFISPEGMIADTIEEYSQTFFQEAHVRNAVRKLVDKVYDINGREMKRSCPRENIYTMLITPPPVESVEDDDPVLSQSLKRERSGDEQFVSLTPCSSRDANKLKFKKRDYFLKVSLTLFRSKNKTPKNKGFFEKFFHFFR